MKLLERGTDLEALHDSFREVLGGKGNTVFIAGEAGIGKTALVRAFVSELNVPYLLLEGFCDSLVAARPLGPLFDIAPGLNSELLAQFREMPERTQLFPAILEAISSQGKPVILHFEDIHWADAATMDFVRFLARRISRIQCLFLVTLRDTELTPTHPYRMILGELSPNDYRKLILVPLSKEIVSSVAEEAGRNGEEIFRLTAGIPFYVREVLASYNNTIPETVRDSILSVYHRQFDSTRELWEKMSVIPGRIESELLARIHPEKSRVVEFCYRAGIIVDDGAAVAFKHELFRKAIEESLTPFRRRELHQLVTDAMLEMSDMAVPMARIVHHARLAEDRRLGEFALQAAEEAALLGAHMEAVKFYRIALSKPRNLNKEQLADIYEKYGYESYLTNQIHEAIDAIQNTLECLPEDAGLRRGDVLRFLSRLHWFAGDIAAAKELGERAVQLCNAYPGSRELASACSNMSQLMMLDDQGDACLAWGEKAIAIALKLEDMEILCHSHNNMGTCEMKLGPDKENGRRRLRESLDIALRHELHEHAARAYTNLGYTLTELREFEEAERILTEGIEYCDARDLHSWTYYMQSSLAAVLMNTGRWDQAEALCTRLLDNPVQQTIVGISIRSVLATIRMRRGADSVEELLSLANAEACQIGELQRMVPVTRAVFEYSWLTGGDASAYAVTDLCLNKLQNSTASDFYKDLGFWFWKSSNTLPTTHFNTVSSEGSDPLALLEEIKANDPYLTALFLIEGTDEEQREGLVRLRAMGAIMTADRVEADMRAQGVQHIPRGPRTSTAANAAGLTQRQMDVLQLLSEGLQNKEIATQLFVSAKTVDHHISAILSKLEVPTRGKAIARAREIGLLE